jgi:hypothetical protein
MLPSSVGWANNNLARFDEKAADLTFLMRLKSIIEERGVSGFQGRNNTIALRSCSVETSRLGEIAEALRSKGTFLNVQVVKDQDHATCVPKFASPDLVRYTNNLGFQELESREVTEIRDERVYVPAAVPWHVREARPPAHLRQGNWMDASPNHTHCANWSSFIDSPSLRATCAPATTSPRQRRSTS